ncbi:MAG: hypothetical protein IPL79_15320 [Myxococcales bacterium]|nr:hypothetical protein [Myxococcales bacterium]
MAEHGVRAKLRYAFDNSMSKGAIAMIAWLAAVTIVILLFAAVILSVFGIIQDGGGDASFIENAWQSLMRTLDAGTMGGDTGWAFRVVMLAVTIAGVFIVSTLIGIISSGLETKLDELRKGRSIVIEEDHTLILGWSSKVSTIISELIIANESATRPRIVVLADRDKVAMEDELREKVPAWKNTKIICRSGNPAVPANLAAGSPNEAKSIVILTPEESANPDAQTLKTILALTNNAERKRAPYHITAEIKASKNLEVTKMVGGNELELISSDELIAKVVVQTCRQSGLSAVYQELLDFDGMEMYFTPAGAFAGRTYREAALCYQQCAVLAIMDGAGKVMVNPPPHQVLDARDQLVVIAEDDSAIAFGPPPQPHEVQPNLFARGNPPQQRTENTLLLGWNDRARLVIREMDNYVLAGSRIDIVSSIDVAKQVTEASASLKNLKVGYRHADTTARSVLDALAYTSYDHILLMCYRGAMNDEDADTQTLITLLHLRNISQISGKHLNIVSEVLDVRNRELAETTQADDFIVSDKLVSLLMSQVSENKHLMRVFDTLFESEGSEIYLKPVTDYVYPGHPMSFYTLAESAFARGETAIGYRIIANQFDAKKGYGIVINPDKRAAVTFAPGDRVIVLAEN